MADDRILRAMLYAEQHLADPLTLTRLAREACISEYHFLRMFHYRTGEGVMEYVRRLRLEHAAYRLRATRRPVQDIARSVGYASPDAFGRAFRTRFDMNPRAYRQLWAHREPPTVPPVLRHPGVVIERCREPHGVQIQRLSGWTMLCTRQMGPYAEVRFAWKQLAEWMQAHGIESANEARIGISHDDPAFVPPAKIRYDACRIVSAQLATELASDLCPPFHLQVMPSAEYAVTVHDGPYHELGRAYRRLFLHWLPSTGRYPAHAPVVERYLNSPLDVPETELRTELLLPLE